jgi:serine/threonine-protein kinase
MPQRNPSSEPDLSGLPQPGETLDGKYSIDGLLGVGGMGVVFVATHLRLGHRVAIKMLLPEWVNDATVAQRFAREGRASAAIHNDHIVRVLDVDEAEGRPYLVLEYLDGQDFESLLAGGGAFPVVTAVDLLLQACEGLAEAHAVGTIHRDLKPANLFLTTLSDGSPCVKVLDFGISKVTSASRMSLTHTKGTLPLTVMGTPHYMSPEQMESLKDVDARTDIWSLGAILHELLAGSPPFEGDTITALCAHVMTDPPAPLARLRRDVPVALEAVVLRCLEKDRSRRYRSVAELARALEPFGSGAAQASAARISRTVEGGIEQPRVSPGVSRFPTPVRSARSLVYDVTYPSAIKRPLAGYALAALASLALAGGVGWKLAKQANAIHAAENETPMAVFVPAPAIPPVPSLSSPPAVLAPTSSGVTTTGAVVAAPGPTVPTSPLPPEVPVVTTTTLVATATPTHVHHHHARTTPQAFAPRSRANDSDENPYASDSPAPASPTTVPSAPSPADPARLFDERK